MAEMVGETARLWQEDRRSGGDMQSSVAMQLAVRNSYEYQAKYE